MKNEGNETLFPAQFLVPPTVLLAVRRYGFFFLRLFSFTRQDYARPQIYYEKRMRTVWIFVAHFDEKRNEPPFGFSLYSHYNLFGDDTRLHARRSKSRKNFICLSIFVGAVATRPQPVIGICIWTVASSPFFLILFFGTCAYESVQPCVACHITC